MKPNSVDCINNLAAMEETVYTLKALRDALQNCSEKSSEAALYGRELLPPQKPEPVKCKIKSIPERPQLDNNDLPLKRSRYFLCGAVALLGAALFLFIVLLFKLDFFKEPFAQSGIWGKALLVVCMLDIIALCAAIVFKAIGTARYREDIKSWESVRMQINEQNEQEIIRCQSETSVLVADYNAKLEEYEKIKSVYTLKESVKSRIYGLLKSKIHVIAVKAEKQLFETYSALNVIPAEYRRFDSVMKIAEYAESVATSAEDAVLMYKEAVGSNKVPEHVSDFAGREVMYPQMQSVCEKTARIASDIDVAVNKLQPFVENVIEKAVSFENQSVNDTVLAIEFAKNYTESSVACFAEDIINLNTEIYEKYL